MLFFMSLFRRFFSLCLVILPYIIRGTPIKERSTTDTTILLFGEHIAQLLLAIDLDGEGLWEAHMAHVSRFLHGREGIKGGTIVDSITIEVVDGEIAHTEGGEVLEKVGALRRIHAIVGQSSLNDDACG